MVNLLPFQELPAAIGALFQGVLSYSRVWTNNLYNLEEPYKNN